MGVNRSRRIHSRGGQRDKFSLARITNEKYEAKELHNLVEQDINSLYSYIDSEPSTSWAESGEVTGLPDSVLYEMGILYDTPVTKEVLPVVKAVMPMEQDADWDIVSEVSEWDILSMDDGFSDDDSWG